MKFTIIIASLLTLATGLPVVSPGGGAPCRNNICPDLVSEVTEREAYLSPTPGGGDCDHGACPLSEVAQRDEIGSGGSGACIGDICPDMVSEVTEREAYLSPTPGGGDCHQGDCPLSEVAQRDEIGSGQSGTCIGHICPQ